MVCKRGALGASFGQRAGEGSDLARRTGLSAIASHSGPKSRGVDGNMLSSDPSRPSERTAAVEEVLLLLTDARLGADGGPMLESVICPAASLSAMGPTVGKPHQRSMK